MSEDTKVTEIVEETTQEVAPLSSWDDADNIETPTEASLIKEAINVGTEAATDSTKSEESVQEVSEEDTKEEKEEEVEAKETSTPEVIKVKVNGKEEEVSIEELKSNYSGKVAYDKKFTELDKERKSFIKEKTEIENYVNEFRNISQSQNMVEATKFLGQITGKAPHDVVNELIDALAPEIERRYSLTEDELSLEQQKAETRYKQEQLETEKAKLEQEKSHNALQSKIEHEMSSHNIDSETWNKAIESLDSRLPKDEVITPELVSEFVRFERAETTSSSALKNFDNGKFLDNQEVVKGLRDIAMENPDFSEQDLIDVLSESLNTQQKQQVEEKISKKVSSKETTNTPEKTQISQPASWDDIL